MSQPQPVSKLHRVGSASKNRIEKSKPARRRAPAACQSCRARKVRCDVSESGSPCMNCRADNLECIVTIGKTRVSYADSKVESYLGGFIAGPVRADPPVDTRRDGDSQVDTWRQSVARVRDQINLVESNPFHNFHANDLQTVSGDLVLPSVPGLTRANEIVYCMQPYTSVPSDSLPAPVPLYHDDPSQLPGWIKPPSSRIELDDFGYLQRSGALILPDQRLRDECLSCFIEWVYPWSPIVDLSDILRAISRRDGSGGHVSLPVFQAIMFAGVGFVEMASLRSAGFESRKDAKKSFFRKVKLLYDFGYDTGQIAIIQTLILMSYWVESADSQKDIWHWIGVAIGTSTKMGLNKDPSGLDMSRQEISLRKRVWWSLLSRDRLTALALRRNIQIQQEDYDMPQLTVDDFCINVLPDDIECPPQTTFPRDAERQHKVALWCIEQAKLCVILGHILRDRYSTVCIDKGTSPESQGNKKTTMALMPRKDSPDGPRLTPYDVELKEWARSLPSVISYTNPEQPIVDNIGHNSFLLHRATLVMLYSTAVLLFYRPLVSMNAPTPADFFENGGIPTDSTGAVVIQEIRTAAFRITQIAGELSAMGLVRFSQPIGVTVTSSAAVVHLAAIYSPFKMIHAEALSKLCICLSVIEQLQEQYIAADLSCHILVSGLRSAGVPLPAKLDSTSISQYLQKSDFDPTQVAKSSFGTLFDLLNASAKPPQNTSSLAENSIIFAMDPTVTGRNEQYSRGSYVDTSAGL
ncbi:uncharacterized protein PV09_04381 [Verruconis gallopava]|uniref:Zn(2)-C6 fungal-type domain-containing protein n=1 Tax=Verruconis gallopava TaxID=253628 RepID=A0A0D2ADU5_9PEZI|nr:uncharacterized protein PV09_04381 [Verruconis gallopava]KIW04635.1 hypothetical protein PV09_04381 [Verruconis gallopava]